MPYAPARTSKNRSGVAIVIALVLAAAGVGGYLYLRNIDQERTDVRINRLVREAAGQQPIKKSFWSKNQQFDDAIRNQYQNLFALNRDCMVAVKNTDSSATSKLGTPDSFADPSVIADGLNQLHTLYAMDMSQAQKQKEIMTNIRHTIETSDLASSDQELVLKELDYGQTKAQTAISAEQAWMHSIDDLYNYAQQNHAAFVLNEGHLLISDTDILQGFNTKVDTMNTCRKEFFDAKQDYDNYQTGAAQKAGLSPKDMGMQ